MNEAAAAQAGNGMAKQLPRIPLLILKLFNYNRQILDRFAICDFEIFAVGSRRVGGEIYVEL